MNWNFFENYHARKLKEYSSEVNAEELWQAIEPQIQAKKDRHGLWFLFPLLCLGAFSYLAFYTTNTELEEEEEPSMVSTSLNNMVVQEAKHVPLIPTKTNEISTVKKALSSAPSFFTEKKDLPEKNSTSYKKQLQNLALQKTLQNLNTQNSTISTKSNLSESRTLKQNKSNSLETDFSEKGNSFIQKESISKLAIIRPTIFKQEKLNTDYTIPVLEIEKIILPSKRLFSFSLGFEIGLGYSIKDYSEDTENMDLINFMKRIESPLESTGAGMTFEVKHRSNFFLQTGINYSRFNQRIKLDQVIPGTVQTENAIVELYTNSNGEVIPILGLGSETVERLYKLTHYNFHEFISVPIMLGYEFKKKSLSLSPLIGINFNLVHNANGIQFSGNNINSKFDLEDSDWFDSRTSLSYHIGLGINYQLKESFNIGLKPYFNFQKNDINSSINPLEQGFKTFGMSIISSYSF